MSIPVERYVDPKSLEEELEKIFWRRCFVAHESDIAPPDSYFSFRLGRRSLTMRRFGSELALLDNVCRHRFNLIDPPGFGERPFRCGYHGWTYGQTGEISFIPFREDFVGDPGPLERHAHLNAHGFAFKGDPRDADNSSIEELISDFGRPADAGFHRGTLHHRCNWKLMVENVLESYHLSVVHPNTFGKSGFTSSSRSETSGTEVGSTMTIYPHERFGKQLSTMFPDAVPAYRHLYIFPNLFVSITNGLIYFVSNLLPVALDETTLHYRLFTTDKFEALKPAIRQHLVDEAVKFTATTLDEDRVILERCQIGILGGVGSYALGARERRIEEFHKAYMKSVCQ